jgi:MFS transporter, SET family, sugar efflux transporter
LRQIVAGEKCGLKACARDTISGDDLFQSLRQIFANSQLTLLAVMIFVQSSAIGATIPYLSVTAIKGLGMSDTAYALLVFAAAAVAVTVGVSMGILSDLIGNRRNVLMVQGLAGAAGYGAIFLFPSTPVFMLATICIIPFFQSATSLLFAGSRSLTQHLQRGEAAAVNTTVRAFMSAAWVLMPAAMGFALANSQNMLGAWAVAACCAAAIFIAAQFMAKQGEGGEASRAAGSGFVASLKELSAPIMLGRMAAMALVTGTVRLSSVTWPLIVTVDLGGSNRDVGIIAGTIALFEIPFMLMWASLLRKRSALLVLTASGLIYGGSLAALTSASQTWHIYALTIPSAAGAAALLSLPLTYFQDLFPGRPGLGTSFYPINGFLGNAMTAIAFAVGAEYLGYSGTPWLGVVMILAGIAGLLAIERRFSVSA